jgi:SAM-dependent methyltransferase
MATTTSLRTFGVRDCDTYWSDRQRRAAVGEAPIHRFLAALVDKYAPERGNVLDCGAGEGHVLRLCSRRHHVYGVELSCQAIEKYGFPYESVVQADLNEGIPQFPMAFHAIVASWLLHWLDRPEDFLRQARRRLAPGGVLIVNVPNITHYRYRVQMLVGRFPAISLSHKNFQTPSEIEAMARVAGYHIVRRLSPKRTLRAALWPKMFAGNLVYVLRPRGSVEANA